MMPIRSTLACLSFALALAACGGEKNADNAKIGGEVLPGSASDAMLPLDTVRSQAPLTPKSEASAGADKAAKPAARAPEKTVDGQTMSPTEAAPVPTVTVIPTAE